ncbi:hypothetical protein ECZU45_53400 [Escherichia coli]|nr:hypothetical protein ECZU45_53400 [Escherichia coli]
MARCTVARLMAVMGLAGVLRVKVRTTISRKVVAAGDRVNRQFVAERPDQLWVADFTYVSTWRGFVYVAFIIDVFAGYIGVAGLIVHGNDIRAGCTGAGVMGPSTVRHGPSQ